MDDIATIGVEVDTRKVRSGKTDLRDFGEEGVKTEGKVKQSSKGMSKAFGSLGLSMKSLAIGSVTMFAALGAGFAATNTIGEAKAFGSALAEVSTLIEGTAKQTTYLEAESRKLAATYGGTGTSQAKAFYQAISAGAQSVEDAGTTLNTANRLAIGGVTDVTTAVGILSTAMNVYSASGLTAAEASDAIFVAVKAGVTTVGELSSALGKVLPLAEKMGLSFDETAAAVAALTKGGLSTAEAVTGLRAALAASLGPSKQAADLALKLGLNFSAAGVEANGFSGFMAEVVAKTDGSAEKMQTLFGSVEAVGAALAFSGAAGKSMGVILEDMKRKAGSTNTAFNKMSDDLQQRLNVVLGKLWSASVTFGKVLLTVIVPALEAVTVAMDAVAKGFGWIKAIIPQFDAVARANNLIETAVDNATIAMGDQIAQVQILSRVSQKGNTISLESARVQLATAGAIIEQNNAIRDQLVLKAKEALGVSEVATEIARARVELEELSSVQARAKEMGLTLPGLTSDGKSLASEIEAADQRLAGLLQIQIKLNDALNKMDFLSPEQKAAQETAQQNILKYTAAIAGAKDGMIVFGDQVVSAAELTKRLKSEADLLSFDDAAASAASLADNLKLAADELVALQSATANLNFDAIGLEAQNKALKAGNSLIQARTAGLIAAKRVELAGAFGSSDGAIRASATAELEKYTNAVKRNSAAQEENGALVKAMSTATSGATRSVKELTPALSKAEEAAKGYSDTMNGFLTDGITRAITNMVDGFKGGLKSIKDIFVNTILQMIAFAVKNRILISLGIGGVAGGGTAALASAATGGGGGLGGLASGIGGLVGAFGTGFMSSAGGFLTGGLSGGIGAIGGQLGATAAGGFGLSSVAASIGAIAAPLLAVAAVFSFFSKKTKVLDQGLQVTVKGMDALAKSFTKIEVKRFWGLYRSVNTSFTDLGDSAAPLIKSIGDIQSSVLTAATALGVGLEAFKQFSYEFTLSLNGMNEEQKMKAVGDELIKMGDAFASIIPGITTLNELLAVSSEHWQLQNRVLQLQGKEEELLSRVRAQQLSATHDLNKGILQQIYALEDQARAAQLAAEATQKAADVAKEQWSLTNRLLELQGNDSQRLARIRSAELSAADDSNRGILRSIYALEDQAKATQLAADASQKAADAAQALFDSLDENNFATLVEFKKAQNFARQGISNSNAAPLYTQSTLVPANSGNAETVIEMKKWVAEIKAMRDEQRQLGLSISANTKETKDTLRKFDVDGMPAVRT